MTTILMVDSGVGDAKEIVMAGDGQMTLENLIVKGTTKKIRRIYNDQVIIGFAGATADALSLFDRLEKKLNQHSGQLQRACVKLTEEWRTDKVLRHLKAILIVTDGKDSFLLSGNGDVISPEWVYNDCGVGVAKILAIGSGGPYAEAAAKALALNTKLNAQEIAYRAMHIASDMCIYTNKEFIFELATKKKKDD